MDYSEVSSAADGEASEGGGSTPPGPLGDACTELGRELLKRLLNDGRDQAGGSDGLSADELSAVAQVGMRHRGQPLSLHPIAVELIRASLDGWFKSESSGDRFATRAAERIAATLFDDPASHQRLESLWSKLSHGSGALAP